MNQNLKPTILVVDRIIAVAYAAMLIPIAFGLYHKLKLDPILGYFADILAVLAALYAGRAVFLPASLDSQQSTTETHLATSRASETPKTLFWGMLGFLLAYALIKAVVFILPVYDFMPGLLGLLLTLSGLAFLIVTVKEFQKDEKAPFWRGLLAVLFVGTVVALVTPLVFMR